jgi:hypothetical protein
MSRGSKTTRRVDEPVVTIAVLTRTMDIRLWDVSAGGCLLEFAEFVPVGTVGVLALELDDRRHLEWFRVCRVHGDEGRRSRCLVGAEFLVLSPPRHDSLRMAIARLRGRAASAGIPVLAGRSSGDHGKSARPRRARRESTAAESKCFVQIAGDSPRSSSTHELAAWLLDSPLRARHGCASPDKE